MLLWEITATRHRLLQSNAYELALFDQWAWLIGWEPHLSLRWNMKMYWQAMESDAVHERYGLSDPHQCALVLNQ